APGGFFELFGRPARESACECERTSGVQLGPVLNLLTGDVLGDALRDPNNRIAKIVAANKEDAKVVEELYVAILCRRPSAKELQIGLDALRGNEDDFAKLLAERKRRETELAEREKQMPALAAAWEKSVGRTPMWDVLQPDTLKAADGATLTK